MLLDGTHEEGSSQQVWDQTMGEKGALGRGRSMTTVRGVKPIRDAVPSSLK